MVYDIMCTTLNTFVQLYLKILNAPFVKELKKNCLFVCFFFFCLFVWFLFFYYFLEKPWSLKLDNKFPSKELDNKRQKHRMLLLAYFQKKKEKKKKGVSELQTDLELALSLSPFVEKCLQ